MLTEACNLDCWMCDFARSKGLSKMTPLDPEGIADLLSHSLFSPSLRMLTFTGGEPFSYPKIADLYGRLRRAYPHLRINFSTNGTLYQRMEPVLAQVQDWTRIGILTSVDGIAKHDRQRGSEGSFGKTVATIERLRARYPRLPITIKFTITPLNYDEVETTYNYFAARGHRFTVKMLENNPYYTSKLSADQHKADFNFQPAQLDAVGAQLRSILAQRVSRSSALRRSEMREVLDSIEPNWHRRGRCATPQRGAFVDCDLNVFTCKEYPPVLNLHTGSLDDLAQSPMFSHIQGCEATNSEHCTRCTSQMKIQPAGMIWLRYLASLVH